MNDAHNALDVNNGQQACRRYIYTTSPILVIHITHHLYPPLVLLPPADPLSLFHLPAVLLSVHTHRYPLPPSACVCVCVFFFVLKAGYVVGTGNAMGE